MNDFLLIFFQLSKSYYLSFGATAWRSLPRRSRSAMESGLGSWSMIDSAWRAALARARAADRSSVVVIDTDPVAATEAGGAWWDVAVPEVSTLPEVQAARRAYEERTRTRRGGS